MSVTYILNIDNGMTLFFVLWSTFICGKHLLHQCKVKCYAFISFEVRSKVSKMTVWSGHVCHANGTILLAIFEQLYRSGAQKFVEMCLAKRILADGA